MPETPHPALPFLQQGPSASTVDTIAPSHSPMPQPPASDAPARQPHAVRNGESHIREPHNAESPADERPGSPSESAAVPGDTAASTPAKTNNRNHWLDAVRGIAVIRVVLWHAFASAFLSWTITTMPAMFFVAGSLLAYSLDKRPFDQLLNNRMKRLLIPYWTLGGALLVVLAVVHRFDASAATDMSFGQFFAWLVPIVDPRGSAWEAGWIATPLWFLRCYLWLLLLSPLYRAAHRKWGSIILAVPVLGIFASDWFIRNPEFAPEIFTTYKWYIGDLVTYSFFLILGFAHHDGVAKRLSRRDRLEWAGVGLAASLLWISRIDVIDNVVNNSYPMLLFVGITWLGLFLAFEKEIASLQTMRYTAPIMQWIGRRAMTVYLWHTTAIVFAYWMRAQIAPDSSRLIIIPIILVATMVLSLLFGWVEDVAAGKPAEWWPGRPLNHQWNGLSIDVRRSWTGTLGGLTIGIIAMGFWLGSSTPAQASDTPVTDTSDGRGALGLPPAPSAKPPAVTFDAEPGEGDGGLGLPPAPSAKPPEAVFEPAVEAPASADAEPDDSADSEGATIAEDDAAAVNTAAPDQGSAGEEDPDEGNADEGSASEVRRSDSDPAESASPAAFADGLDAGVEARVQDAIDHWRDDHAIEGLYLGVSLPQGEQLLFTSGALPGGEAMSVDDDFDITSVTKTMTSALIMSLADDGTIELDDLIPDLDAFPDYPFAGRVTYRQLLMHASGITTYKETDAYTADGWYDRAVTVDDALLLSASQDLAWEPGTEVGYSSTGYFTLGLLAGQWLGTDYETALQERIFDPVGMPGSYLDTSPYKGWVGFSSGGVRSNLSDLLKWGSALYRDRTVISNEAVEAVIDLDNPWSAGLGSYPVCPCYLDDDGNKVVASMGHNGGQATIQWSWEDDLVIAAGVTEPWTNEATQSHIVQLLAAVRDAVAGT